MRILLLLVCGNAGILLRSSYGETGSGVATA